MVGTGQCPQESVESSLVLSSFPRSSYVLTKQRIPLSARFPPAPAMPSKPVRGRFGGGHPVWGTPFASCECKQRPTAPPVWMWVRSCLWFQVGRDQRVLSGQKALLHF